MKNYSDIIGKCSEGERSAQMDFYALFHRSVFNSSYRILEDREEAEEVMQETILKVLTRTELLKADKDIMEATLKRIAINHSIDICRKRKADFVEFSPRIEKTVDDKTVSEEVTYDVTIETVKKNIESLPKGYRMILTLKLIEGLDYEEISDYMQIAQSAVRSQYSRARQKLAEILRKDIRNEAF